MKEEAAPARATLTLEDVQQDPVVSAYIAQADRVMDGLGFTEHGFRLPPA